MIEKKSLKKQSSSRKPYKKRVYRLKLEIDIFAMLNEETERIERGLQISVKDSDVYFDNLDYNICLRMFLEDEYDFFSRRCFNDLKVFLALLRWEVGYNQLGDFANREVIIANCLKGFEKRLRKRLNSIRGRPKEKRENELSKLFKSEEVFSFVKEIQDVIFSILDRDEKPTKTNIADNLFPNHSNAILAFNRKLKKYYLDYDNVIKSITHEEYLYENLVAPLIKKIEEKHNNNLGEI